ncbi:hypothetical protein [Sphingobacterium sp.]|uniref:hypothetical protein n=1 Tax=Sphingobacterium sp. TaxID=341027 RepID=UPI002899FD17|nr:hypothetical protein [Sphingobacterium sp.]
MNYFHVVIAVALFSLAACSGSEKNTNVKDQKGPAASAIGLSAQSVQYRRGDLVPTEQVCMVNDAFMGKKQLLVRHQGRDYYGCCEMCKKRIPQEVAVRVAIDPFSKKEIDKATASIAITGDQGEVSYFENEANYRNYIKNLNL